MVVIGIGVGFLFAVVVLTISVVSFPMLLDRPVGVGAAINTSVRAVLANPAAMAAWGFVVAFGLVLGSRSEEHTSELQSLMRISYAVFCLKKKKNIIESMR